MSDADIDIGLVERFRAGDEDAVRQVYRHYGRLVFTVALRVLGDRQLAEDATQQAFLQAWRAASTFDPESGPRSVAGHHHPSSRNRHAAQPGVAGRPHRSRLPPSTILRSSARPPSAEAIWETWQVRAAIDALPPDEREVVRLQHMSGHSHSEIAEHLGLALGTVKSRSHRAHQHLAVRLQHLRKPIEDG